MKRQSLSIIGITLILLGALFVGTISALEPAAVAPKAELSNVRAYAATQVDEGLNYAVDGGTLFAGTPNSWARIETPADVIVNAVAVDKANPATIYVGAANELAIYRTQDSGRNWQQILLTADYIGGVTDIAVDSVQHLVYVGTDNAGLFRLRDVGSSMLVSGHLLLDEPVLEVAADNTGAGMALARTAWHLYRAEDYGLRWHTVDNLGSVPTALAIADTTPATIFVGTVDRGLVKSQDGLSWTTANEGLNLVPGSRLQVDALAVDPQQPETIYVATSYLFGSTTVHQSPIGVAVSRDGATSWNALTSLSEVAVAELLPVSNQPGAVYALMANSRTPLALGTAPVAATTAASETQPARMPLNTELLAWYVAGIAALALLFAVATDLRRRRPQSGTLQPSPAKPKS